MNHESKYCQNGVGTPDQEAAAVQMHYVFFKGQDLMFEPCRIFVQRYWALLLDAARIETQFETSFWLKTDPGKRLNGCFNKEFNGRVMQVNRKQLEMRDFLERVRQVVLIPMNIRAMAKVFSPDVAYKVMGAMMD